MTKKITLLLLTLISLTTFGQNATELNEQSNKFLQTKEYNKAIPLIKRAAELGNADAQYKYGIFLEHGLLIEKNIDSAVVWSLKSAKQGLNSGLHKMVEAYLKGVGAEQSDEKSFEYVLECAENNYIPCMFDIPPAYQYGIGIEKNLKKMLEWAIKLGKLKNPMNSNERTKIASNRRNLALMYRDGKDVKMDLSQSYSWYLIYNELKIEYPVFQQQKAIKEIQELEKKLTSREIEQAKKQAAIIYEGPLTNLSRLYETSK